LGILARVWLEICGVAGLLVVEGKVVNVVIGCASHDGQSHLFEFSFKSQSVLRFLLEALEMVLDIIISLIFHLFILSLELFRFLFSPLPSSLLLLSFRT
jgi:hypothetical protein